MLWFLFSTILCVKYKCINRAVFVYEEAIEKSVLKKLIDTNKFIGVKLKLEYPFEEECQDHRVISSSVNTIERPKYVQFCFKFFDYNDFSFSRFPMFTEFNFSYLDEEGKICNKNIGGFLGCVKAKRYREGVFLDCTRKVDQNLFFYKFEDILIKRASDFIEFIKSYPDEHISNIATKAKESFETLFKETKNDFYRFRLKLIDLLAVMSKNRDVKEFGIKLRKREKKGYDEKYLKEYTPEVLILIRKLEIFFKFYFMENDYEEDELGYDCSSTKDVYLIEHDTDYFELFNMMSFLESVVTSAEYPSPPKTEINTILAFNNIETYNTYVKKHRDIRIVKTRSLYIEIKDENDEPCTENVKLIINLCKGTEVLYSTEVFYLGEPLCHDLEKVWPENATSFNIKIKED